jgi:hypothetical protein
MPVVKMDAAPGADGLTLTLQVDVGFKLVVECLLDPSK